MKKNKLETKMLSLRLEGVKYALNCELVRVQSYPDIHKIHHREKFPEYMDQFQCERDTVFFRKNRAIIVTKRTAGDVIFSGQFRMRDGEPQFIPLVAYCNWQGVKRDFFLLNDCELSSVEREYRESLSEVPLRTWQLKVTATSLEDYLENRLPLSPGCVISCLLKQNVDGSTDTVNRDELLDYYRIFKQPHRKAPETLESRLSHVRARTLEGMVNAKMPLTKAGQRWHFWHRLIRAGAIGSANQKIQSWIEDRLTFTSGVTVTLSKEDAKAFLEGRILELRTSYGLIDKYQSLLVCGCHRLCVHHVREVLEMPAIDREEEEHLPPFLEKLKRNFEEIKSYNLQEIEHRRELYSASLAQEDKESDDAGKDPHVEAHIERYRKQIEHEIATLQGERQQFQHEKTREIRVSIDDRYAEVKKQLRSKLVKTSEFENAVRESEDKIKDQFEQDKKEVDFHARSADCLESLRQWVDFVSLDYCRYLLKTC